MAGGWSIPKASKSYRHHQTPPTTQLSNCLYLGKSNYRHGGGGGDGGDSGGGGGGGVAMEAVMVVAVLSPCRDRDRERGGFEFIMA